MLWKGRDDEGAPWAMRKGGKWMGGGGGGGGFLNGVWGEGEHCTSQADVTVNASVRSDLEQHATWCTAGCIMWISFSALTICEKQKFGFDLSNPSNQRPSEVTTTIAMVCLTVTDFLIIDKQRNKQTDIYLQFCTQAFVATTNTVGSIVIIVINTLWIILAARQRWWRWCSK